jgi:ribosomal protein S13
MARIAGVNIPTNKRTEVGLTYVYGIGPSTSRKILAETGVDPNTPVKDLTEDEVVKLREAVESQNVEGDLRRSAPTAGCATAAGCRFGASAPRQTPAGARARSG